MPAKTKKSPRILSVAWGKMEVEGFPPGKDFILYPGGAEPWDWNRSGTSHEKGIQPRDIDYLLQHQVQEVILSTGFAARLQVSAAAIDRLVGGGVNYRILITPEAVEEYNRLAVLVAVGGLFHSTC